MHAKQTGNPARRNVTGWGLAILALCALAAFARPIAAASLPDRVAWGTPEAAWVPTVPYTIWPNPGHLDRPLALAERMAMLNPEAVSRALADMGATWPGRIDAAGLRARLGDLAARRTAALHALKRNAADATATAHALLREVRETLLANPLLDFDRLLLVRRDARVRNLALPYNWESLSSLPRTGIDDALMMLSGLRGEPKLELMHRPANKAYLGELALHFDAKRLLFSSIGHLGRWRVFEIDLLTSATPRELPLIPDADVDNYTGCYLPDDSILFTSTAPFIGVPCVRGASHVAHLYRWRPDSGKIRRLTFDQEHNWCPTVLPDGRVLYLRWEYSDLPHFFGRILFTMNPDGSGQREFYGSNSYWPNSFFYARPMPGHPRKVAGIVTGHHGVPRMGELTIIDPALGRHEASGVVQRIPGFGKKVEPRIYDRLVDDSWPKFLHPVPLSDKYLLTACKPTTTSLWGIYLVDVFDNLTLIKEVPGHALLEPTPVQPVKRPPVIPDAIREGEQSARMQIVDIYQGPGLAGVPRGTIKKLRLLTYTFSYQGIGGQVDRVGLDGPWDIKRILGVVPVEADGSAYFEVPANMPIAMQPLDASGRAVALMRSWTTAMPGETQSCVGCHEKQNAASALARNALAMRKPPARIEPFYGPLRGFAFEREVQPVLDRHCISCHNGQARPDGLTLPDFTRRPHVFAGEPEVKFPPAYVALKAYVRTPTLENDMRLLRPAAFHASTTELIQLLEAGHHGVRLDAESWDRLNAWIDLNTPAHGSWLEMVGPARVERQRQRRRELTRRYAGLDDDPEVVHPGPAWTPAPPPAAEAPPVATTPACPGWPFDAAEARRRQQATGPTSMTLNLGGGVGLSLVRIPAGRFVAGGGATLPRSAEIAKPFWIGATEVTNAQFSRFDPGHDSGIERGDFLQFAVQHRGVALSEPQQPVSHVSWNQAEAFCAWLAARTGRRITLPSGDAWEYACRAGAATPMAYGAVDADFSRLANLADVTLRRPPGFRSPYTPEWRPAVTTVNDGYWVSAPAGSFPPNAWGVHEMHGNVWEWTREATPDGRRLARGGSWHTRPQRAIATAAQPYQPWQQVYDVGFRIVIEE